MHVKFFNGSVFVQQIRNDFRFSAQPYRDYEHITTAEKLNKAPDGIVEFNVPLDTKHQKSEVGQYYGTFNKRLLLGPQQNNNASIKIYRKLCQTRNSQPSFCGDDLFNLKEISFKGLNCKL